MKIAAVAIAAVVLMSASGCSQQQVRTANHDAQRDLTSLQAQAKPKLKEADNGARVLAALVANDNLPKTIRVDASPSGVRLKGTVENAKQKHLAGEIAKQTLKPNESVDNELTVK